MVFVIAQAPVFAAAGPEPNAIAVTPVSAGGVPRGPVVTVPHCRIETTGCGLDPKTPDLDPAACAATIALHLERRGLTTIQPGPFADVCATDSTAVVMEATITAVCPAKRGGNTPRDHAVRTILQASLQMRDCAGAVIAGTSETERALESGRATLLRDAVEEFSHHVSERKVRSSHPGTPLAWIRADLGREHRIEVRGGVIDVERSAINDLFVAMGIGIDDTATTAAIEWTYNPWRMQRLRLGLGFDAFEIHSEGDGLYISDLFNADKGRDPNGVPVPGVVVPSHIDARIGATGLGGSLGYGFDLTRHQRLSGVARLGYYVLGTNLTPAVIDVEIQPAGFLKLKDHAWGGALEIRYEWRFTPHFAVSAGYGWNHLRFRNPNRPESDRFLPVDVEFSGQAAFAALAGRF